MDFSLPEADLFDLHLQLQAAAFALLFEHEHPATEPAIAARAGLDATVVATGLAEIEAKGMLRRDERGDIIGIAGITIEPTRHRIEIGDTIRWTWCALDAVGIIGALGRGGRFTTSVPDTGQQVEIEFSIDGRTSSAAVVFIADGFTDKPVVDNWCPTVNLFPDADGATRWAEMAGVTGQPIAVTELISDAAEMWDHVTMLL